MVSFNTIAGQMTNMSQRKKKPRLGLRLVLPFCVYYVSTKPTAFSSCIVMLQEGVK